jgi:hypothetical protein
MLPEQRRALPAPLLLTSNRGERISLRGIPCMLPEQRRALPAPLLLTSNRGERI